MSRKKRSTSSMEATSSLTMSAFEMKRRRVDADAQRLLAAENLKSDLVTTPDASDDEVLSADEPEPRSSQKLTARKLSSWQPTPESVHGWNENGWLRLRLTWTPTGQEQLLLMGQYELRVARGAVSIYGAVLREGKDIYRVFAPSTHALPSLSASGTKATALIEVRGMRESMRELGRISPLFRNIWNDGSMKEPDLLSGMRRNGFAYLEHDTDDPLERHLSRLEFQHAVNCFRTSPAKSKRQIAMVCGVRGAGKSTLCRSLVNDKLTTTDVHGVYYLDLDPGQTEFSPAAQISLLKLSRPVFGPPYSHPIIAETEAAGARIVKAHALPSVAYNEGHLQYETCCLDLIQTYHSIRDGPLVINCPGINTVNVLGLASLKLFAEASKPTDVAWISEPEHPLTVQLHSIAQAQDAVFHQMPVQGQMKANRSATQLRDMMALSYFHARLTEPDMNLERTIAWHREPIYQANDGTVAIKAPLFEADAVCGSGDPGAQEHHFTRFEDATSQPTQTEGQMVALVWVKDARLIGAGRRILIRPHQMQQVCLGLIRDRDAQTGQTLVYTPQAQELMRYAEGKKCIIAMRKKMQMPWWAQSELVYLERERRRQLRREAAEAGALTSAELELLEAAEGAADSAVGARCHQVGVIDAGENFQVRVEAGEQAVDASKKQRAFEYGNAVWRGVPRGPEWEQHQP